MSFQHVEQNQHFQFTVQHQLDLDTELSIFETGIKVVDLLAPYRRGVKIGSFGGAGVGKIAIIMELINNIGKSTRWCICICRCR